MHNNPISESDQVNNHVHNLFRGIINSMSNPRNDQAEIDRLMEDSGITAQEWNAATRWQERILKEDAARGYPLKDDYIIGKVARDGYGNQLDQPVEQKDNFDE